MKKMYKKILALILLVSLISNSITTYGGNIYEGFENGSYDTFIAKPICGVYRYWVYKYSKTGKIINTNRMISTAISHTKGRQGKTLVCSEDCAYSYSTTATWNTKIKADYGIAETISASAEAGYGVTTGWSISQRVCNSISITIPKNAKTGDYALAAGHPFYKMRVKKYNWITDNLKKTSYFYMPYGSSVIYTVRSLDNQESWEIYD